MQAQWKENNSEALSIYKSVKYFMKSHEQYDFTFFQFIVICSTLAILYTHKVHIVKDDLNCITS